MREIKESTILVAGGAGFIGSNLVDRLLIEGAKQIIVIDNLFCGREENLEDALKSNKIVFIKDDAEFYTSLEYIFEKYDIDVVMNCATKALNYSFVNPSNAFDTNTKIILNLLEFQRKGKYKTLCHFSTSEVYGTAIYEPMDEFHPRNPMTTYAAGKAAADLALETYVRMFNIDAFIVRPFNNYGPRQNYKGYLAGVIPLTAWRLFNGKKPEVYGSGSQSRDFIYVEDTVDAIIKLFPLMQAGDSVNISTNNQVSINDVIDTICKFMNYNGEIERKPARGADVMCHNADNSKIKKLISWKITPFAEGIKNTIAWYMSEFEKRR